MGKKSVFLFLALLLPIVIFIFLKFFGKNEFRVVPLFTTELPVVPEGCASPTLPYHIPDSVLQQLNMGTDTLALILVGGASTEGRIQLNRLKEEFASAYKQIELPFNTQSLRWSKCIFFLPAKSNLLLINNHGVIRGQYEADKLAEMDRLIDELTIILKRY